MGQKAEEQSCCRSAQLRSAFSWALLCSIGNSLLVREPHGRPRAPGCQYIAAAGLCQLLNENLGAAGNMGVEDVADVEKALRDRRKRQIR